MKTFVVTLVLALTIVASRADEPYHFVKEIPIAGAGGWDYLTVDASAQRLYVSRSTEVVVIDVSNDSVVGEITNTPGVHGIALYPAGNRGFVSDGRANHVSIFDLKTLNTVSTVDTGANPDAILFEPSQKEVYAFNGRSKSASVISAESGAVVATIPLDGKPEFAQADPVAGLVFDNLEDKNEVAVIDVKTHSVTNNWPIAPGESASGMAIDTQNHRIFLGCENHMMEMLDTTTGKVLANVPIGEGVDANAFDPGTKFAFASCGDGTTTIAREDGDQLTLVQTLKTERSARTMALDTTTHKIYLPSAKFGPLVEGQRRPQMIPGTFKILVFGTGQK